MEIIAKNIKHLRVQKKLSQEQLGMDLELSQSGIAAYESGRNEPSIRMLIRLSDFFRIPIDVLLRADLLKSDEKGIMKIGQRMLLPVQVDSQGRDNIEVISAKASAGYLNGYADPEFIEGLPAMKLPFQVIGKNRAFPIRGDSMPPASTGDFVIGKYLESYNALRPGDTYIVITKEDGIVYKRVYPKGNKHLSLHSDNPQYEPYTVELSSVLEIWEYVCLLRTRDTKEGDINIGQMIDFLKSMQVELQSKKA